MMMELNSYLRGITYVKAKYIGPPITYIKDEFRFFKYGDTLEVERLIECIEHYGVWYRKINGRSLDNFHKMMMKGALPMYIRNDNRTIQKKYVEILNET